MAVDGIGEHAPTVLNSLPLGEPYRGSTNADHCGLQLPGPLPYDFRMPALIFWLLVIAAILFFKLTTRAERRAMIETYWIIIAVLFVIGIIWQLLRQGTLSA